ncbi:NfeD family protein [Hymenobacter koreensis]|uniref:NfeD family protein n=1 Tax=Hymenobacter koreensis TaxID=1084523 RepID=A0ABP8IXS5_9BACT
MDWLLIVVLLLFGALFLVAEVLLIPGTTIVGLAGFVLLTVGIWLSYRDLGPTTGHVLLSASVLLVAVVVWIGLRPQSVNRFALTTRNTARVDDVRRPDVELGQIGRTLSALRPAGTVLFGEERREATTQGEFVESGAAVRVLRIDQNRIVVAAA